MASRGLYGSSLAANLPRVFLAELIGTYFLVLIGTGVAVAAVLQLPIAGAPVDSLAVALAFGLVLTALVCVLGHISGCHLNPAVTIGLTIRGKFPWKYALPYVVAQGGGALLASLTILTVFGEDAKKTASLGATQPTSIPTDAGVLVTEMVMTFMLVFVITSVATDDRVPGSVAGIAVGFTLFAGVLFAGPVTGGGLNPARSFALMLIAGKLEAWPMYLAGQLVGGALAVAVYDLLRGAVEPSKTESADS